MRPDAALKYRVPVIKKMMRGDGCAERVRRCLRVPHVFSRFLRRNVFKHDLQTGKGAPQRVQYLIDKYFLPVKEANGRAGTSPCTSNGSPISCIASKVFMHLESSVTPASECVVAPAGSSLMAWTMPDARA